jgi:uncharacterized protein YndB with AHSA1/START domain
VTDALLVRAPVGVVYRTLTDLDGWPRWLPGCRASRDMDGARDVGQAHQMDRHRLVIPLGLRRSRIRVESYGWRHDQGVRWEVSGTVRLSTEWWLEQRPEGTVVHHVVHPSATGTVGRRAARRALRHRRSMVLAMQAMKDHLELAVAVAAGRVP